MNYSLKEIGSRIKRERKSLCLSQGELAEKCNLSASSRQTVGAWEQGILLPSVPDLLKLCSLFDCELGYLLGEYDRKTREATDIYLETGLSVDAVASLLALNDTERNFVDALLSSRSDLYFIAAAYKDFKQKKALNKAIDCGEIADDLSIETLAIKNTVDYARFTLLNRFQLFAEGKAKK